MPTSQAGSDEVGIPNRNPLPTLSPIHILSGACVVTIPLAFKAARDNNNARYARIMRGNFAGMCVAGLLAFLPGRTLYRSLWPEDADSCQTAVPSQGPGWFG